MAVEPTTIVHPSPAKQESPRADQQEVIVSFEGQEYQFPSNTTDDEVMEFMNTMTFDSGNEEEPPEPLREQAIIKKDEGVKKNKEGQHVSYKDAKVITGGRGHQLSKEELKIYPLGTVIPDDVVDAWFKEDMEEADAALISILEKKSVHVPDEVYDILLNMSFNLGQKSLTSFKDMWAAIEVEDWATAAVEMEDSKWFKQVKNRAVRLVNRMAALAPATETNVELAAATDKLTPAKGGLFEDENGKLFMVDDQGNKKEV